MPWLDYLLFARFAQAVAMAGAAYCLGCFTTAFYFVRWRTGQDIRLLGSGTAGARNAGRLLGWPGFLITLLGDFTKGAVVVAIAQRFSTDQRLAAVAMIAVVAGHIWPFQLRFQGGKGVSTSLGALLLYDFRLALAFALLFALLSLLVRKSLLPGLFAFTCLPLVTAYFTHVPGSFSCDPSQVAAISMLAGFVLLAHRKNLAGELSHFFDRGQIHPKHQPPEL